MVRAVGTLAVVGAGLLGFWVGYLVDSVRNPVRGHDGRKQVLVAA
ncbi:hypothetical protein [Saccharopolyspora rectivirgula]|jgi:hypothetical protein|nr:hypothetical protein [Saccharopolyspora rectivirgula]